MFDVTSFGALFASTDFGYITADILGYLSQKKKLLIYLVIVFVTLLKLYLIVNKFLYRSLAFRRSPCLFLLVTCRHVQVSTVVILVCQFFQVMVRVCLKYYTCICQSCMFCISCWHFSGTLSVFFFFFLNKISLHFPNFSRSKRVIELGSGYGLAGLVIAAITEAVEVVISDGNPQVVDCILFFFFFYFLWQVYSQPWVSW